MNEVLQSLEDKNFYPTGAPDSITEFLIAALNIVLGIGFALAFVNFAWGFIQYIMSKGDPKATQQAWNSIIYGLYAILVSMITVVIRVSVLQVLGVKDPNILTPPNF